LDFIGTRDGGWVPGNLITPEIFIPSKSSGCTDIGGYEFEGVFTELEQLPSNAIGVYVVLCLIEGRPHCVLYIGTSEGGPRPAFRG
jgi:hypothetical protein